MSVPNPKVDFYFNKAKTWREEIELLRAAALSSQLTEELKWGNPCYTFQNQNIVLIHTFKEYCAVLFFKGALLPDPGSILIRQTENVQAARQIRFTSARQIAEMDNILKDYIHQAIEVEKSGQKVDFKKSEKLVFPVEFTTKLDEMSDLKAAFEALTPGRQKGYQLYFTAAKLSKTRESRIEKCVDRILDGKGLDDA